MIFVLGGDGGVDCFSVSSVGSSSVLGSIFPI